MLQDASFEDAIPLFGPEDLDYDRFFASAVVRGLTQDGEEDATAEDFFKVEVEAESTVDSITNKQFAPPLAPAKLKEGASVKKMQCEGRPGQNSTQAPRKQVKSGKGLPPVKSRQHAKDNKKRKDKAKESSRKRKRMSWCRSTREKTEEKHIQSSQVLTTGLDAKDLPTAQGAYWARRDTGDDMEAFFSNPSVSSECEEPVEDASPLQYIASAAVRRKLSGLIDNQGFKYQPWKADVSHPVLDSSKRVVTVLVGKPKNGKYDEAIRRLFGFLVEKGATEVFADSEQDHRRGQFPALNIGLAVGPGSSTASRIHVGSHGELVEELLGNEDLQRLASHQDASFHAWAPKLHSHYSKMNKALIHGMREKRVKLDTNFDRSVYSSMAVNFPVGGKSVCTVPHRDVLNLPYGWCAVHALGDFDAKAGGHIILWELKLIVEFPAGACILLPSATVTHFNVPIRPGDLRASITQYTGGNLFRFVDNNFRTDSDLRSKKPRYFKQVVQDREKRWMNGLSLLRKYDEETKRFI